eukprot:g3117.t1
MANNEDIVKTLAKMVDERLTVEFEKRDKAILDLKKVEDPDDVLDDTVKTLDGTQNEENIVDNNTTNNEETNDTVVEEGQGENLDGGDQVE